MRLMSLREDKIYSLSCSPKVLLRLLLYSSVLYLYKFIANCRKFLDVCHSLIFLFCVCLQTTAEIWSPQNHLPKKHKNRVDRVTVILPKNFDPICYTVHRALCLCSCWNTGCFWDTSSITCVKFKYICTVNQNATQYNGFRCLLCLNVLF